MSESQATLTPGHDLGQLKPTLVRASAGTGKTYQLTARLLRILFHGASPESILATTFTRKAASEILHRLLVSLAEASDPENTEGLEKLREQVQIPSLPRTACLQVLSRLMHNIHRIRICTLDSLFSQLARSFPFELGLPPAWRLLDDIEERWSRERAVDQLIIHSDPAEITTLLSMLSKGEVQRSISRDVLGVVDLAYHQSRQTGDDVWDQLRVPSGPESAAITRAAGHLFQADAPQKSVKEKLAKVAELLEARDFRMLENDTLVVNYAKAKRLGEEVKFGRSKLPKGLDEALETLYDVVKTEVLSLLKAQNLATGSMLGMYDRFLHDLRQSTRALGFDDVAIRLAATFNRLDSQMLASRMDGRIDHVLLDEFQDTSPVQWSVLRHFARQSAKQSDSTDQIDNSFFCVGDTKQAIYGWRGGVAEIFDTVTREIEEVVEVEQNLSFRSSPVIMDVVTDVFQNLSRHSMVADAASDDCADKAMHEARAIEQFANRFPKHDTAKRSLPGYFCFETADGVESSDAEETVAAKPKSLCFSRAAEIVSEIHTRFPSRTIGVLTRTNSAVAELIYYLSRYDLLVSQEGGNPLTDSSAVEVILSALMCAEHPGDGRWAFHVRSTPLGELLDPAKKQSDVELGQSIRKRIEHDGLVSTLSTFSGALVATASEHDTLRMAQLTKLGLDYEQRSSSRLRDFVRLVREKRVERPQAAKIRVMTVHQAKGLEFDAVVLPELDAALTRHSGGCVADRPGPAEPARALTRYLSSKSWHFLPKPWQQAFGNQAAAEMVEALCLLYVAMTRARQALHIVIPPASNARFEKKTAASLVYHALAIETPPNQPRTMLYELGDSDWGRSDARATDSSASSRSMPSQRIILQPLPPVPRRNRVNSFS